jgi:pyruvate/2-oxoglutarate dehydrogenase complex dihydrolipoamide acyltransferase (E2) component
MRIPIEMPQLGFDMPAGRIAAWLVAPGDQIERGHVIADIETEKTTVGMEALASGTLVEIVHGAGDEVPVGEVIAWLEDGAGG